MYHLKCNSKLHSRWNSGNSENLCSVESNVIFTIQAKPDFPAVYPMAPMMRCNTAQFSGAMEVETHGLGDDTGLDCFAAMSPDIELSRMVAVTTGQSLTSDISSR